MVTTEREIGMREIVDYVWSRREGGGQGALDDLPRVGGTDAANWYITSLNAS